MKKLIAITAALVLAVTFSGCLSTLHPLFKPGDLIFDSKLTGNWKAPDDSGSIVRYEQSTAAVLKDMPVALQQLAGKSYTISVMNKVGEVEQQYLGFLVRIGSNLYMDYYPLQTLQQKSYPGIYMQQFIPMHTIYKLNFRSDGSFEIRQFDSDYLEKLIKQKQLRIRHETSRDGGILVTAPTEELQQYVLKYGNVAEAYESPNIYQKI